jgi:hypothetical protein
MSSQWYERPGLTWRLCRPLDAKRVSRPIFKTFVNGLSLSWVATVNPEHDPRRVDPYALRFFL